MNLNLVIALIYRVSLVLCLILAAIGCSGAALNETVEKSQPRIYETPEQAIVEAPELRSWKPLTITISEMRTASNWISIIGKAVKQTEDAESVAGQNQDDISLVALVFRQADDAFSLVEISLGDFDAEFPEWIDEYSLPVELFYDKPPPDTQWGNGQ